MDKLEFLRKLASFGGLTIEKVFKGNDHIIKKYFYLRTSGKSNFDFVFELDKENANKLFDYLERK